MYKCYGITKAIQPTGFLDAVFQRAAQARRIRRFCTTNNLLLSGNFVLSTDPYQDLRTAMSLYEAGWIDFVVVSSKDIVTEDMNDRFGDIFCVLDTKNAVIALDERRIF